MHRWCWWMDVCEWTITCYYIAWVGLYNRRKGGKLGSNKYTGTNIFNELITFIWCGFIMSTKLLESPCYYRNLENLKQALSLSAISYSTVFMNFHERNISFKPCVKDDSSKLKKFKIQIYISHLKCNSNHWKGLMKKQELLGFLSSTKDCRVRFEHRSRTACSRDDTLDPPEEQIKLGLW